MATDYLSLEWQTLQNQFDSYEKYSLLIKLVAIFTTAFALGFEFNLLVPVLMVGVFWVQDGIWKTFQARFETRLLIVEAALYQSALKCDLINHLVWHNVLLHDSTVFRRSARVIKERKEPK